MRVVVLVLVAIVAGGVGVGAQESSAWELAVGYTVDGFATVSPKRDGGAVSHLAEAAVGLNLEVVVGWQGARAFVHGLWTAGEGLSGLVGGVHGISNIEAPSSLWLFEAWLEQRLAGDAISLRAGLYDLNSEFDVLEVGEVFLNPSHGIGPEFGQTGRNGPSIFPWTALGIRADASAGPLTLRAALLDGVPGDGEARPGLAVRLTAEEGMLMVMEAAVSCTGRRFALGAYRYTTALEAVGGGATLAGTGGLYALGETALPVARGLTPRAFVRLGLADSRVNPLAGYIGAGVVIEGTEGQALGLSAAVALGGSQFRAAHSAHGHETAPAETVLELTYRLRLGARFQVQPDLQYVMAPSLHTSAPSALLLGVRLAVRF